MTTVVRSSSLNEFPDCPRRWAAKTMRSEVIGAGFPLRSEARSIGAAIGTGMHSGIAWDMTVKMETGELAAAGEAEARGVASLEDEIAEGCAWDETSPNLSAAQRQVARMTRIYHATLAPRMEPVMVEKRLEADDPTTGLTLSGQADLVVTRPDDLNDHKSGRTQPIPIPQLGSYSLLRRANAKPVTGINMHYVPRVPIDREQPAPIVVPFDLAMAEATARAVLRRIAQSVSEFRRTGQPEAFLANPSSRLCSDKWCGAWGTSFCRAHRGAK